MFDYRTDWWGQIVFKWWTRRWLKSYCSSDLLLHQCLVHLTLYFSEHSSQQRTDSLIVSAVLHSPH